MSDSTGGAPDSRPVKLSCRNIWKVYGTDPAQFFDKGDGKVGDPDAHTARIRDEGHIVAAGDVSFDVHAGEIFIIMGLSGSGKSTMVRCLSRLVEPTAGEVLLDGENLLTASEKELIEIRRHKMGMVFQNFGLLPHQTVLQNVAFPLKVQGVGLAEREAKAREMISLVGLDGRENAFPRQLSGGQQQRVGIARSLCVGPEMWFLDEPFSALDPLIRRQMQDEFVRLQTMLHKTIVFITHDFLEALKLGDRICIMKDGRVVQIGTPSELVLNPADDYVAEFTEDVPLVRVIRVRDVMEPITSDAPGDGSSVSPDMCLEEILPAFAGTDRPLVVRDGDGKAVGRVTPAGVVKSLAAGEKRQGAAQGAA
ncbi:MAG: betaine/proline/choline family ABC transporter ATP-binding protein [Alphaproteobacteria bacterium]